MKKKCFFVLLLALAVLLYCGLPALAEDGTSYYSNTTSWDYTLRHDIQVKNSSSRLSYNIELRVPLLDAGLPLYARKNGEQLTPYPAEIQTEPDGQRTAVYRIPSLAAGESLTLNQSYAINIGAISYYLDWANLRLDYSDKEKEVLEDYLQPEALIQSNDSAILSFSQKAVGGEKNPYRRAQQLFSAVNLSLAYSEDSSLPQDARSALSRKTAHCEGYTNLYVACLRAMGIPARVVSGYLYVPEKHVSSVYVDQASGRILLDSLRHVWVEFYLPETGWVAADPTFTYTFNMNGSTQKFIDWSYFANISTSRRYIFFSYGDSGNDKYQLNYTGGQLETDFSACLTTGKDYVPFNDLQGHWAAEAVTHGVEQGYFKGLTDSIFSPDSNMTRAMFVTVLGRLYQSRGGQLAPFLADLNQFYDIDKDAYYGNALGWALDCGLIDGYGDGRFGPNDPITREQMCKIIAAFVSLLQEEQGLVVESFQVMLDFPDLREISVWAMNGVELCVSLGLVGGYDDSCFHPMNHASRAQVATILQRIDNTLHN